MSNKKWEVFFYSVAVFSLLITALPCFLILWWFLSLTSWFVFLGVLSVVVAIIIVYFNSGKL